jgi:hypothetical protein
MSIPCPKEILPTCFPFPDGSSHQSSPFIYVINQVRSRLIPCVLSPTLSHTRDSPRSNLLKGEGKLSLGCLDMALFIPSLLFGSYFSPFFPYLRTTSFPLSIYVFHFIIVILMILVFISCVYICINMPCTFGGWIFILVYIQGSIFIIVLLLWSIALNTLNNNLELFYENVTCLWKHHPPTLAPPLYPMKEKFSVERYPFLKITFI